MIKPSTRVEIVNHWGDTFPVGFAVIRWMQRYRIYRWWRWISRRSPIYINAFGFPLGYWCIRAAPFFSRQIRRSWQELFPRFPPQIINRYVKATCHYLGGISFDLAIGLGLAAEASFDHYFRVENQEILDRALEQQKGVIMPVVHIGQFVHYLIGLCNHPHFYHIIAVVHFRNLRLYNEILKLPHMQRLKLVSAQAFRTIKPCLERYLRENCIILIYYDYGTPHQFRVPCNYPSHPFLITTPQSTASLSYSSESPIIPCLACPDGVLGRTLFKFLEDPKIQAMYETKRYLSKREYHGKLSLILNSMIYSQILRCAHVWEEITRFAERRMTFTYKVLPNQSIDTLCYEFQKTTQKFLHNSYEPHRNDIELYNIIEEFTGLIRKALISPQNVYNPELKVPEIYQWVKKTGIQYIQELLTLWKQILEDADEQPAVVILQQIFGKLA